jgi:two-component system cell cycle sensor histidine kinase/response regulator CckA
VQPTDTTVLASIKNYASRLIKGSTTPSQLRVLVVDDEDGVLRYVERVLSEAGYQTSTASNGAEALDAIKKMGTGILDVLVTDVMMPGITGDELARQVRAAERGVKVLYLTGFSDRLFKEKASLSTDEAFLEKPFTVKGLREAVSLLVSGHVEVEAVAKSPQV